jgi:hypothetical protein
MSKRADTAFDPVCGQAAADPSPFVLTITSQHVARRTRKASQSLAPSPLRTGLDVSAYIDRSVNALARIIASRKAGSGDGEVLK